MSRHLHQASWGGDQIRGTWGRAPAQRAGLRVAGTPDLVPPYNFSVNSAILGDRRLLVSNRIRDYLPTFRNGFAIFLGTLSLYGLYAISRYDFLIFHCLAEAFSIIIAIAVFAIFWNTRQYLANGFYLVIGFGCLFAGMLDVIYIFGYKGMSVFPGADANIALQAKTVAQWFVSLSCVGAFPFLRRKIQQAFALAVYSALTALALASIFYWRVFPDCYVEGVGQTLFERIGLVLSCSATWAPSAC